jgi:hypothetical protein
MFYSTDPNDRAGFIASLRMLADFLEDNPAVPVPTYGTTISLYADACEDGGKAQVDRIARFLNAAVTDDTRDAGHYVALRRFGDLTYEARSIPAAYSAMRDAQTSYEKCIILD